MKVTITLGERSLAFVTGIPEEELPEILSDVLERSLEQQVRSVSDTSNDNSNDNNSKQEILLNKILDAIEGIQGGSVTGTEKSQDVYGSRETKKKVIKELIKIDLEDAGESGLEDYLDMLK